MERELDCSGAWTKSFVHLTRPTDATSLIDDEELRHHMQVFMVKNVEVEHIRNVLGGISVEPGGDNDLALGIHQHGVLPS